MATRVTGDPELDNNGIFFIHSDHLGSTSLLSYGYNLDGTQHAQAGQPVPGSDGRYLPFGGWRTQPTAGLTDRGFTGHKMNDDLGLIYMNARYYSPYINRFVSTDSIVPDPTNPQSYNRYSYGYNNPVKYQDPTGHRPTDGCEYEGCELDDYLDPNETWITAQGQVSLIDPVLAAQYPGDFTWEEALFTATGFVGISALPATVEYGVSQVVWPALVKAGGTIASWLCLKDGDCGNEAQAAANVGRQSINWLTNQANRVNHIINPNAGGKYRAGHDWSQLINYSGNQSQDYQALQPYLDAVVQHGASTTTATGQSVFAATVNNVPIEVIGNMQNGVFVITDAWIVLP
ncbi:MAG TPA: RHS repeat-associated core domain-containing protein [Chloroflexota bacterium]|nr:RHS repeat-associated core domain-containing protein [Chloroflexota bacterium]